MKLSDYSGLNPTLRISSKYPFKYQASIYIELKGPLF